MQKLILNEEQIREILRENRYKINPETRFLCRCIDGRYGLEVGSWKLETRQSTNNQIGLPALAIPGADCGELAIVFSAANTFGFEVDEKKAFDSLVEVVNGLKNLRFHTDTHAPKNLVMGGCGHMKKIEENLDLYNLTKEQLNFIKTKAKEAKKKGAKEFVLEGDHQEGAVVIVRGGWSVYPRYVLSTSQGPTEVEIFVFHQSLVDERHKALVKALIKNKAVKIPGEEIEEYLYMTLTETTDLHLFETAKFLAKELPIYQASFENSGDFELSHIDTVK